VGDADAFTAESRSNTSLMFNLKILLGFFQVGYQLQYLDIPWPSYFLSFIAVFDFLSLGLVPWTSVKCAVTLTIFDQIVVTTIVPLLVLLALVLVYIVPLLVFDRLDMADSFVRRQERQEKRAKFWKLVLFTLFLLFPAVSSSVLSFFACREVDGSYYLVADFRVQCYAAEWNRYLGYVIVMVLVYPVGIPLTLLAVLLKYRKRLSDRWVAIAIGFLYQAYDENHWFFELVDMMHKLFLCSLLAFIPVNAAMCVGMVVACMYAITIMWRMPYIRHYDDRIHLLVQTELILFFLAGYIFRVVGAFDVGSAFDVLTSIVLILLALAVALLFVAHAFIFLRKRVRTWQRQRGERLEKEFADESRIEWRNTSRSIDEGTFISNSKGVEMATM